MNLHELVSAQSEHALIRELGEGSYVMVDRAYFEDSRYICMVFDLMAGDLRRVLCKIP